MIPIRDDIPSRRFPPVTTALLAANVFAFLLSLAAPAGFEAMLWAYGAVPYEYWTGREVGPQGLLGPPWTVLTSMFLHGGLLHLAFNLLFLAIFGNDVEEALGPVRFLAAYLLAGTAAAALQILVVGPEPIPMVGASGAIAGVLGAFLVIHPRAQVLAVVPIFIFLQFLWLPAWVFLAFWFVVQVVSSAGEGAGVAWHAHIGGFVAGILLGWLLARSGGRARAPYRVRYQRWSN